MTAMPIRNNAKPAPGKYKNKAENLSAAALKRQGATKAAASKTVNISNTNRATTGVNKGYTLGPKGNRLTGKVVLSNGNVAVYKGGKRVTNKPRETGPPPVDTKKPVRTTGYSYADRNTNTYKPPVKTYKPPVKG